MLEVKYRVLSVKYEKITGVSSDNINDTEYKKLEDAKEFLIKLRKDKPNTIGQLIIVEEKVESSDRQSRQGRIVYIEKNVSEE